jgi:hypothetical protein
MVPNVPAGFPHEPGAPARSERSESSVSAKTLGLNLPGHLLNLDNDELGWFQRGEADNNIHDP